MDDANQHKLPPTASSSNSEESYDFSDPDRKATGSSVIDKESVIQYGRSFHGYRQGQYPVPNDSKEQERLDLFHMAMKILLDGRLHLSPILDPRNILDIGTGTGIWALQMAKIFPGANVVGTDLSAIQPQGIVENCIFVKEDAENDEWTVGSQFDFIHWRAMLACFTDWDKVFDRVVAHLVPGGWIELHETIMGVESANGSHAGSALERWMQIMSAGLRRLGRDPKIAMKYKGYLQARGLVVHEKIVPVPIGGWPDELKYKRAGLFEVEVVVASLDGTSLKLAMQAGLTADDVRQLSQDVKAELKNHAVHAVFPLYLVYAQKPR